MNLLRYDFVLQAEQPIAHHAESFGNTALVARRKVRQPDGSFAMVPSISGDTMRHSLRESAAYMFLDAAGLLNGADEGVLTRAALRLLFNGGAMTGRGDTGAVSLDRYREIAELCPPLALLGGCADSRVIPGRVNVDEPRLCCEEQRLFLPDWAIETASPLATMRSHVEEVQRVRMDSLLDPSKRKLLTGAEQVAANALLESGERAHKDDDAIARDEAKSMMLPRSFEAVVQGSMFYWGLSCATTSELDVDTLHVMLAGFLYRPIVGGKKATGHGLLRVVKARQLDVRRPADRGDTIDTTALGQSCGQLFRAHVADRRDRIKDFLRNVAA